MGWAAWRVRKGARGIQHIKLSWLLISGLSEKLTELVMRKGRERGKVDTLQNAARGGGHV